MPTRTASLLIILLAACGDSQPDDAGRETGTDASGAASAAADVQQRPERVTDTLMLEGMAEPIDLRLFSTPEDFPLGFSAYVPDDMATEVSGSGDEDGAVVRFVAEFGGNRNDQAFIHLFVHPEGTDPQQALAVVRAYQAADGIPVSKGLEPLGDAEANSPMRWADQAYTVRYQTRTGWFLGSVAIGTRQGRVFHLLTHYPEEYADGFAARSGLILETWRWADGEPLRSGPADSDITIPSARPDSLS